MSFVSERLAASLSDRYRLDRELGAGGMATVYLAHDLKHDRDVEPQGQRGRDTAMPFQAWTASFAIGCCVVRTTLCLANDPVVPAQGPASIL